MLRSGVTSFHEELLLVLLLGLLCIRYDDDDRRKLKIQKYRNTDAATSEEKLGVKRVGVILPFIDLTLVSTMHTSDKNNFYKTPLHVKNTQCE